jgi:tetratricopeptide (TPR) repeat protein
MAAADNTNDWKKRESLPSALIQIVLVGALLAAAVWFVYSRGTKRKDTNEKLGAARLVAIKDNPNDLKKAVGMMDEILKSDSDSPDVLAAKAYVLTELWMVHKDPSAEGAAKETLVKAEKTDDKARDDHYASKALQILAAGNAKQAEDYVEEQRKKGASTAKLAYAQALALKAQGNLPQERAAFTLSADKGWKDPQFTSAFGDALLDEGQTLSALDYYNKGLSNNPDHLHSKIGIALARIERKDRVADAEATLKDMLAREAELSPALKARALAATAELRSFEAQYDDAVKSAEDAIKVNPEDPWGHFAKAKALALKKDGGASSAFDAAVAKAKTSPLFYFDGAVMLQQAGNTPAALALLDKYEATFKPIVNTAADGKTQVFLERDDRYWLTRGDVLRDSGKLDEALTAYDKAINAKNVNLVKATYAKGSVYLAKKDFDEAAKLLVDITPPDGTGVLPEAYVAMGEILFNKKDWPTGCQNYAFALTKMKQNSVPREQLNDMLTGVEKKLIAAGQRPVAKLWMDEAKPLIQ